MIHGLERFNPHARATPMGYIVTPGGILDLAEAQDIATAHECSITQAMGELEARQSGL